MIGQVAANIRQKNTAASDRLAAINARLGYVYMVGGIRKSSNVIASHLSLGMAVRSRIVYFPIAHIHSQQ